MLLADKRDLKNSLKVALLAIEEKELNYYTQNCMTVGTQAALLAGFAFATIVEVRYVEEDHDPDGFLSNDTRKFIMGCWLVATVCAMALETITLIKAMQLSILGPGLALRGPEGSMTRSLTAMRVEYHMMHKFFYTGLGSFLVSVGLYTWAIFSDLMPYGATAVISTLMLLLTAGWLAYDHRKLMRKLGLPKEEAKWIEGTWNETPKGEMPNGASSASSERQEGRFPACSSRNSRASRASRGVLSKSPSNATILELWLARLFGCAMGCSSSRIAPPGASGSPTRRSSIRASIGSTLSPRRISLPSGLDTSFMRRRRRGRRRGKISEIFEGDEGEQEPPPQEMCAWLYECLSASSNAQVFGALSADERRGLASSMTKVPVPAGHMLIREGDTHAQSCYIISEGSFEVRVGSADRHSDVDRFTDLDDSSAHDKLSRRHSHDSISSCSEGKFVRVMGRGALFGDIALLFDSPRTATVVAQEASTVWALSRRAYVKAFRDAAVARTASRIDWLRSSFGFFDTADYEHLKALALALRPVQLAEGDSLTTALNRKLLKQGMVYLLESGSLSDEANESFRMTGRRVVVYCPSRRHDEVLDMAAEWDEARSEYLSVVEKLQGGGSITAENVMALVHKQRASVMREIKEQLKREETAAALAAAAAATTLIDTPPSQPPSTSDTPSRPRRASIRSERSSRERLAVTERRSSHENESVVSLVGLASLARSPALSPGKVRRSSTASDMTIGNATEDEGMRLTVHDPTKPPLRANGGGARLLVTRLAHFCDLIKPMHRLIVDWEDMREEFTSMPLCPGREMLDVIRPLLSEQRTFEEGEVIMAQGECNTAVYLMLEGEAHMSVEQPDGSRVACASRRRGDFFGERPVLGLSSSCTATVRAFSRCVCAVYDTNPEGKGTQELPLKLRGHLEMVAAHHSVPETLDLSELEHVADIGSGGFGTVMLMRHRKDGRPIALKCLRRSGIGKKESQRTRVMAEKRLMVESQHPFIIKLLGTFKDSERLFIGMEYAIGGELYAFLEERPQGLTNAEVVFVIGSVNLMIEHIHSRGFIYRDLKPENVLMASDGYLKLIDFGFCKELARTERTFTTCGTLEYMAPEFLLLNIGQGYEVDFWAMGILMYELFHTYTPFIKDDPMATDAAIIKRIRDPLTEVEVVAPTCSPAASELILGLLQYEHDLRYDAARVRNCTFFEGFDWSALLRKKLPPPFEERAKLDPFDTRAFDPVIDEGCSGEDLLGLEAKPYVESDGAWDAAF